MSIDKNSLFDYDNKIEILKEQLLQLAENVCFDMYNSIVPRKKDIGFYKKTKILVEYINYLRLKQSTKLYKELNRNIDRNIVKYIIDGYLKNNDYEHINFENKSIPIYRFYETVQRSLI